MDYLKTRDIVITLPTTELWMDCYQAISTEKLLGIPESQNRWKLVPYNHYIPPYTVAVFWTINSRLLFENRKDKRTFCKV